MRHSRLLINVIAVTSTLGVCAVPFLDHPAATAQGSNGANAPFDLSDQKVIDEGARLFFQETFDGNGRTCGTCHPATASFTLTPAFIAALPPDDPLFVVFGRCDSGSEA